MDTLLAQMERGADQSPGIPFTDWAWTPYVVYPTKPILVKGLLFYTTTILSAFAGYTFDPPAGSTYSLIAQAGSPMIATIQLPIYGPTSGWKIKFLGDNGWQDYALTTDGFFDFGSGATEVYFYPVDALFHEISQIDPFFYDLTFTSPGDFVASLEVGESFVEIPTSPAPEPATLLLLVLGLAGIGFHRARKA